MTKEDLQNIDVEIQHARSMKKVFLGLSAMWRRKAEASEKRAKKFEKCKSNPGLFRVGEKNPAKRANT